MVFVNRHKWRIVLEVTAPWITYVKIHCIAVAVHLPVARYRHFVPACVGWVERGLEEVGGALVGMTHPVEVPNAVERKIVARQFLHTFLGLLDAFVCKVVGMHSQAVNLVDVWVLPFLVCLCHCAAGNSDTCKRNSNGFC